MLAVHAQVVDIGLGLGRFREWVFPDHLVGVEVVDVQGGCRHRGSDHRIFRIDDVKPVSVGNDGLHAYERVVILCFSFFPPVGFLVRIGFEVSLPVHLRHGAGYCFMPAGEVDEDSALVRDRDSGYLGSLE